MTCPCEMGNLIECKSLDECCLKLGYFTTPTVIYLFSYLMCMTLEIDDNDDRHSSDDAATAQSQESEYRSDQPDSTTVPELEVSTAGQALGLIVSLAAQDHGLMSRLDPMERQFVQELVTSGGSEGPGETVRMGSAEEQELVIPGVTHNRVSADIPRAQSRRNVPD